MEKEKIKEFEVRVLVTVLTEDDGTKEQAENKVVDLIAPHVCECEVESVKEITPSRHNEG